MNTFYCVYVLKSLKDGKNYTGYTKNLKLRFEQHCNGKRQANIDDHWNKGTRPDRF